MQVKMTDLEDVINRFGDRVYWMPNGNGEKFYLATPVRPWIQLNPGTLRSHLEEAGFFKTVDYEKTGTEKQIKDNMAAACTRLFNRFLVYIRQNNYVAWAGELAGLESGFHKQKGVPMLILDGMK